MKGWVKIVQANENNRKSGEEMLISDKRDFIDFNKIQRRTLYNNKEINVIR